MTETKTIGLEDAKALISRALITNGLSEAHAASVATALVAAEAEGQVGHGFSRLEDYVAQALSGKVNRQAKITSQMVSQTGVLIDADHGFAYPALDQAIEAGTGVAASYGTATMSVMNSHHCGALSVQVERLAAKGLIGLMVANTPSAIAPWGAKTPLFGTNPIAFAAPRRDGPPLVIDLSLSRVARGKIMHAKKSGASIPEGWALDADGNPTTDPETALAGSMVPIGDAKGTALALIVEILASVLTGSNPSHQVSSFFSADGPPPGAGQFLMAMQPDNAPAFLDRLEALLSVIDAMEGARLPGTRRITAMADARANGLVVPRHYLDAARKLAGDNS